MTEKGSASILPREGQYVRGIHGPVFPTEEMMFSGENGFDGKIRSPLLDAAIIYPASMVWHDYILPPFKETSHFLKYWGRGPPTKGSVEKPPKKEGEYTILRSGNDGVALNSIYHAVAADAKKEISDRGYSLIELDQDDLVAVANEHGISNEYGFEVDNRIYVAKADENGMIHGRYGAQPQALVLYHELFGKYDPDHGSQNKRASDAAEQRVQEQAQVELLEKLKVYSRN